MKQNYPFLSCKASLFRLAMTGTDNKTKKDNSEMK